MVNLTILIPAILINSTLMLIYTDVHWYFVFYSPLVYALSRNGKQKALCYYSRGQETPVVPPQFTALRRPYGGQTAPRAVSGSPVRAYFGSARPLRKEFHIPSITASHPPAALWDGLLNMY